MKNNPKGNYKKALENGANIIQKSDCDLQEFIEKNLSKKELFIEEGGRVKEAEFGIKY